MSYECLTSYEARERLRQEKNNNTAFWNELQKKSRLEDLRPTDDDFITEDTMPCVQMDEEDGPDDSDITPAEVIADIVGKTHERCIVRQENGSGLSSAADTSAPLAHVGDDAAPESVEVAEETGRGKRKKKENSLYAGWWRHEAKDGRDMPCEPGMDIGIGMGAENKRVQRKFTQLHAA